VFIGRLFRGPLQGDNRDMQPLTAVFHDLPLGSQILIIDVLLKICSNRHEHGEEEINGIAALLDAFLADKNELLVYACDWLSTRSGGSVACDIRVSRAIIALIARHEGGGS
jgi:hypothetical protein